jgi:hypothetical protein
MTLKVDIPLYFILVVVGTLQLELRGLGQLQHVSSHTILELKVVVSKLFSYAQDFE